MRLGLTAVLMLASAATSAQEGVTTSEGDGPEGPYAVGVPGQHLDRLRGPRAGHQRSADAIRSGLDRRASYVRLGHPRDGGGARAGLPRGAPAVPRLLTGPTEPHGSP